MNSSYVLISIILSARLGTDREPPVGCLGKYMIVTEKTSYFYEVFYIINIVYSMLVVNKIILQELIEQ